MTKREYLRHEHTGQKQELERVTAVLRMLQQGTDHEATEMLARLRMGATVDDAYELMFEGRSRSREPYRSPSDEAIDPALTASEGATESPYAMEGMSPDHAGGPSAVDVEAGNHNNSQTKPGIYRDRGDDLGTMPTEGSEWTLRSPVSTCSLADLDRSEEQSNIDPALRMDAMMNRSASYSAGTNGF